MPSVKAGIEALGDRCEITEDLRADCDVAISMSGPKDTDGRRNGFSSARRFLIQKFGNRRLVVESPAFRQGAKRPEEDPDPYWRMSWNGFLRDEADYALDPGGSPRDRWDRIRKEHGITVSPWRREVLDSYILLCLQKPWDASLRGVNVREWLETTIARLRSITSRHIKIRPHPLDSSKHTYRRDDGSISIDMPDKPLYQSIREARAMVCHTSLSAIESICAGVPTYVTSPGNLAWPVCGHNLSAIESAWEGRDREPLLCDISYMQWKLSEIRTGLPWSRLRKTYFKD